MARENQLPPDNPAWCHHNTSETKVQCCEEDLCNTRANYTGSLPGETKQKQTSNQQQINQTIKNPYFLNNISYYKF